MPQYGNLKIDSFLYNNSGTDVTLDLIDIAHKTSPTFTGNLTINAQGDLRLADADSSNYVGFQAPATVSSNLIWTLPAADGGANQVLKTDGSGNLGWATDVALTLVDEDNMASNSATSVPSQQSVKAYADLKAPLASPTFTGDVTFTGASYNVVFDASDNALEFADNAKAIFGTGSDLQIYNDGNSRVHNTNNGENLILQSDYMTFRTNQVDENILLAVPNGSVKLYYNGVNTFLTDSNGITVQGPEGGNALINLYADEGDDNADKRRLLVDTNGDFYISNYADGAWETDIMVYQSEVRLYYDNSIKLQTTSTGINVTGTAVIDGITIDGAYEQVSEAVSALDIDVSTGNYFTKTINANSTFTFSNPAASGTVSAFTLELTHTSGTITWPTTVVWNGGVGKTAPTVATGKTHLFMFVTDDAGTTYRGAVLADYDNAA